MSSILLLTASPRPDSHSTCIAKEFVHALHARNPASTLVHRDLTAPLLPHMGGAFTSAIHKPAEDHDEHERQAIALSNTPVNELLVADTLVISTALINFGICSTLKSWIDHIGRVDRTFQYGPNGPVGLVTGKKAYIVLASGGVYSSGPAAPSDHATPYLRAVLAFIGITDVQTIRVEGVNRGPDGVATALAAARTQIAQIESLTA